MNSLLDTVGSSLDAIGTLSCKGALLALVVGAAIRLLRRKLSPAWRHGLWLLVLVRLVAPDVATSPWSMSRWMKVPRSVAPPAIATMDPPPVEPVPFAEASLDSQPDEPVASAPSAEPQIITTFPTLHQVAWTSWQWLAFAWLLGAGCVVGIMVVLHLRMRARVRRDGTAPPPETRAALHEACALARVWRAPDLIITDAVCAPALFGIVRPAILLPRDFAAACEPAALKLILLHELAHQRRRDLWTQVAASLVIALHWFNPLVWWAGRRMRAEAEMAADARVLRWTSTQEAQRMGGVLLAFAHQAAASWVVWLTSATLLGIAENKRDLRHRIEALTDLARGRRTWWLMGLAAFVALAITGLTKAPAEDAKKDAAPTTATTPATTITVKGIVVDDLGKPIPDARCYLSIGEVNDREVRKSTSDAEGRFRFESVPGATELSLRARHSDFMDSSPLTQEFKGDEPKGHRIVLPRATGWLTGVVTRKSDGTPVKNAPVYIAPEGLLPLPMLMSFSRKGKTDEAGRYRILKLSSNHADEVMIVDAPGLAVLVTKFTWKEGGIITLDHALEPDTGVSGKVVNADGKPVPGASVALCNRMYMMRSPMRKSRDSDYYSALSSYWLGNPETDDKGAFTGRGLDPRSFDELRLVAEHPTEGFIHVRLKDWTPGGTLKLERWATLHGKVTGPDNKPLSDARMEFNENQFEKDADGKLIFSVMHKSTVTTDKEGRYRAGQILPHSKNNMVRVNEAFAPLQKNPLEAGETREFDISLAPKDAQPPKENLRARKVTGRVSLPSNFPAVSDSYDFSVLVGLLGERGATRLNPPGADGRFESSALEPGEYLLRIWLDPKDEKLSPVIEKGVSMIFKLEADAKRQALDLGEFKLAASDFAFRPAAQRMAEQAARKKESDQRINSPVAGGVKFTTWTGSGGRGVGPEQKVSADGRIVGTTKANLERFIIRGTKADGSQHFSTAQVTTADPDAVFEKKLTFTPAAVVEGKMNNLPADYEGDGWVVATVWVWNYAKPGVAINGAFPVVFWNAWASVQRDGKFRFAALPRGSLTLTGVGKGWSTRGTSEYNTDVLVNLLGAEPVTKLSVDTMPAFEQRVRLLRPDGSPAAGAAITVMRNTVPLRNLALEPLSRDVAPEDAAAYERCKNTTPHSHRAVADAEGNATLGNLSRTTETCEVRWTDPKTKAAHVEKMDLKVGSSEALVVKLTGKAG